MRFKVKLNASGGYIGAIEVPTSVGKVSTFALGDTKADALKRAALIAERIASDPVMAALMPPQAQAAIAATKALANAARQGPRALKSLWGRIRGPGKKRLAAALHKEAVQVSGGDFLDEYGYESCHDCDDLDDIELAGRKRRRVKRKRRARREARAADDAPLPDDGGEDVPLPDDEDSDGEPDSGDQGEVQS